MTFWTHETHYGLHYARVNEAREDKSQLVLRENSKGQTREIGKAQKS